MADVIYTINGSQFNIPSVPYENGVLTFEPGYGVGIEDTTEITVINQVPVTENRAFVSKTIDPETGIVTVETAAVG